MGAERIYQSADFAVAVYQLVEQIAKNNRTYEEACVAFFGVTTSQGGTILAIPLDKTLKMNELSAILGVDRSTMTRMVDQLFEKGLVSRSTGQKDRRQVQICLTETGRKLHHDLAAALEKFYQDSLDRIPAEEQPLILKSLKTVNQAIGKGLDECCKKYCRTSG